MNALIAEDDAVTRRLTQSFLEKWGHRPVTAADGVEAWERFQAADFPLVISDWMMPGLDGVELIRRIRTAQKPFYVYAILLTAKSEKGDLVEGMGAGADSFLSKPFDQEELRVRVQAGERIIHLEQTLAEQNRALREAQAALIQTEKLASLGQLAAGVAHEINNPIAFVTNNLAVLRRDVLAAMAVLDVYREGRDHLAQADPDLAARALRLEEEIDLGYVREAMPRLFETSRGGLQRVRDIVRNLCDFARLDEGDLKEVDLNAALTSTLEILRAEAAGRQVEVRTEFGDLPAVSCQPGRINQVFLNILMNAVQACAPGGVVTVRTRADAASLTVEVADTGSGIRPEHLSRLFEPFFTTKPVGQGTGLGLSVSYGIIRDHGGTIEVESEPGKGSRFRVRIPRHGLSRNPPKEKEAK